MLDAIKIALQVLSLGFVISMVVALLIKLTYMAIDSSTRTSQPVVTASIAANQEEAANQVLEVNPAEAGNQVEAANQVEAMVSPEPPVEKPISTRSVSPEIVAVITGAVAALLNDQNLERYEISSIQVQ